MKKIARWHALLIMCFGLSATAFGQSATYDFTGYVAVQEDTSDPVVGTPVFGTYTFDLGNATYGSPGGASFFLDTSPGTEPLLMSSTIYVGGNLAYTSGPPGSLGNNQSSISAGGGVYIANEETSPNAIGTSDGMKASLLDLNYGPAMVQPYSSSTGLPIFLGADPLAVGGNRPQGDFTNFNSGTNEVQVVYYITSFTPNSMVTAVPEPSTYAIMIVGLVMLGGASLGRRKSARSPRRTDGFA